MNTNNRTVLGIDASTQSLSAVLLDEKTGEILWNRSLAYRDDPRLVGFGFEQPTMIIPPREAGEAQATASAGVTGAAGARVACRAHQAAHLRPHR